MTRKEHEQEHGSGRMVIGCPYCEVEAMTQCHPMCGAECEVVKTLVMELR